MLKLVSSLVVILYICAVPLSSISADWKQYSDTPMFKAYIDYQNIKKKDDDGNAYDVWTLWDLTKEGKNAMLPKKYRQKAKALNKHWNVYCKEKSIIELSSYLFDKTGKLLESDSRVNKTYEMVPGTLSEVFINNICNSNNDTSENIIETNIKTGISKAEKTYKDSGIAGVYSYVEECYKENDATKDKEATIICAAADIWGMLVDGGAAMNSGWPRAEYFLDATVKNRVKKQLADVDIDLNENELNGFINKVSNSI